MADRDDSGVGSARRRRERRLRSWWRHERMTVAAELAVALHHSRGVGPTVPHEALRGQTPGSSWGRRPGVLMEPVVVEHAACPCSGTPLLVVPSLAAAESDGVDGTSLKYLLKLALKEKEKEEEKMRREEEEAARSELVSLIRVPQEHRTADQVRRITAASRILSTAHKRKRKKRRKKRTPKSSSFRSSSGVRPRRCGQGSRSRSSSSGGCGGLREHVRQVPASFHFFDKVVDIPVMLRRQVRLFTGAVLGQGCFPARYCATTGPLGPHSAENRAGAAVAVH